MNKSIKRILLLIAFMLLSAVLIWIDQRDRYIQIASIPENEFREFLLYKTDVEVQEAYKKHYEDPQYLFPRGNVKRVLIYKNIPFFSRLTNKEINKNEVINFVNNHNNFDWSETTWADSEAEYILRFYDFDDKEVGKMLICLEACGMTDAIPFAPTMKYGGLSTDGRYKLSTIIDKAFNKE